MIEIAFNTGELAPEHQAVITAGFIRHSEELAAPPYRKERFNWLARGADGAMVGALTADLLWDWLYVDELWTDERVRGQGIGKKLMRQAEEYSVSRGLSGLWLWTQSWQAADFYRGLGYAEFANFPDFPKGHFRIGLRKTIGTSA